MRKRRVSALAPTLAMVLLVTQGSVPAAVRAQDAIPSAALGTLDTAPPAESPAHPASTHLSSHADSLAFQIISRIVGPQSRVRVLGPTGSFEARGSDVTLQGIRAVAPSEAGGPGSSLVSWSEIQKVQVRGNAAGKGALIGGTTLAVIGLGLAVVVSTVSIGFGPPPDPSATKFVAITFGFATAGAVVGGMVGALTPSWKTVHTWAGF